MAGGKEGAGLVKAAFATLDFPISDIEVFHTEHGNEFASAEIDLMLEAFGIERSLSAKGCLYDNAVDESTSTVLEAELVLQWQPLRSPRPPNQAVRLRALVQRLQNPHDARLHEPR